MLSRNLEPSVRWKWRPTQNESRVVRLLPSCAHQPALLLGQTPQKYNLQRGKVGFDSWLPSMDGRVLCSEHEIRLDSMVVGAHGTGCSWSGDREFLYHRLPPSLAPLCSQPRGWCHSHSRQSSSPRADYLRKHSTGCNHGCTSIQSRLTINGYPSVICKSHTELVL